MSGSDLDTADRSGCWSGYLELIRELVRGDPAAYRQRCTQLDETGWADLGLVIGAAYFLAVRLRGGRFPDQVEIIWYVAGARAELVGTGFDVDPRVAERLIGAATISNPDDLGDIDPKLVVESEMLLLWRLLRPLPDDEMSRFLAEVDLLATRWAAE
ncbi:hypothetical protein [Plantactinospora mayteni]|uniref:hypothetical protein n=1 Tax=Plantactinospora mayteni TaxID=566021 RepID=UPI0019456BC7|nr:hypothetical protein [Plantactinospora mayteni]